MSVCLSMVGIAPPSRSVDVPSETKSFRLTPHPAVRPRPGWRWCKTLPGNQAVPVTSPTLGQPPGPVLPTERPALARKGPDQGSRAQTRGLPPVTPTDRALGGGEAPPALADTCNMGSGGNSTCPPPGRWPCRLGWGWEGFTESGNNKVGGGEPGHSLRGACAIRPQVTHRGCSPGSAHGVTEPEGWRPAPPSLFV